MSDLTGKHIFYMIAFLRPQIYNPVTYGSKLLNPLPTHVRNNAVRYVYFGFPP